jgi:hypothetical protein
MTVTLNSPCVVTQGLGHGDNGSTLPPEAKKSQWLEKQFPINTKVQTDYENNVLPRMIS